MKIKMDSKLYRRVLTYAKPYFGLIALGMFLAAVVSALNGTSAWLVQPILDDIFLKKNKTMLMLLPLVVIILYILKGAARYTQSCLMRSVGQRIITKLRYELFEHLHRMSMSFFERIPSAVLMARITNDVNNLSSVCSKEIADFAREIATLLAMLVVIFWRDYVLASISILVLPLATFPLLRIGRKLRKLSKKRQEKIAEINTHLQETFIGNKIVKAFCMEEAENEKFDKLNQRLYHLVMKSVRVDEITSPLVELSAALGMAAIIWYGGYQVLTGETSPGAFFSFMAALLMMYRPTRRLFLINNRVQEALASAERVFSILDTKPEIVDHKHAVELGTLKKKIEFSHVDFQYKEEDGLVLRDINLEIHRGEMIALVGISGAGKSTLADLIPRFYDVTSGNILIDDIDIKKYTVESLRRNIGIVTQGSILFNDTVHNNIAYGRPDCTHEAIVHAAQAAYAHEFITQLPDGYDSVIGERGCNLSGGQRQRLAIARAILKDADILILDEATSDLDTESEHYVQKALENLMRSRTALVIAHRISTIINADKIAVFDNGRIIDMGRHEELINKDGIYRNLYETQFRTETTTKRSAQARELFA